MKIENLNNINLKNFKKYFFKEYLSKNIDYLKTLNLKRFFLNNEEVLLNFFELTEFDKNLINHRFSILVNKIFIKYKDNLVNEKYHLIHKYYNFFQELSSGLKENPLRYQDYYFIVYHKENPINIINPKIGFNKELNVQTLMNEVSVNDMRIKKINKTKKQYVMKDVISILLKKIRMNNCSYKNISLKDFFEIKETNHIENTDFCLNKTKDIVKNKLYLRKRKELRYTSLNKKNFTSIMSSFLSYYNQYDSRFYQNGFFNYLKSRRIKNNFFKPIFNKENISFQMLLENYLKYMNFELYTSNINNEYFLYFTNINEYIEGLENYLKNNNKRKSFVKSLNPKRIDENIKISIKNTLSFFIKEENTLLYQYGINYKTFIELIDKIIKLQISNEKIISIVKIFDFYTYLYEDEILLFDKEKFQLNMSYFMKLNKILKECNNEKIIKLLLESEIKDINYIHTNLDLINNTEFEDNISFNNFLFEFKSLLRNKYIEEIIHFEKSLNIPKDSDIYYIALNMNVLKEFLIYLKRIERFKDKYSYISDLNFFNTENIKILPYNDELSYLFNLFINNYYYEQDKRQDFIYFFKINNYKIDYAFRLKKVEGNYLIDYSLNKNKFEKDIINKNLIEFSSINNINIERV